MLCCAQVPLSSPVGVSAAPDPSIDHGDPSSLSLCPQVAAMGCRSFALLFDDIDPCMCQADRDVFPSLAQAQASVANEVYQELGQPSVFLFCPTGTAHSPAAQTGDPPQTGGTAPVPAEN